jgi:hypothetical protein
MTRSWRLPGWNMPLGGGTQLNGWRYGAEKTLTEKLIPTW